MMGAVLSVSSFGRAAPTVLSRGAYIAALRIMAWQAAGWPAVHIGIGVVEAYGPRSVARTIDLDVLEMCGCLDAKHEEPSGED